MEELSADSADADSQQESSGGESSDVIIPPSPPGSPPPSLKVRVFDLSLVIEFQIPRKNNVFVRGKFHTRLKQ